MQLLGGKGRLSGVGLVHSWGSVPLKLKPKHATRRTQVAGSTAGRGKKSLASRTGWRRSQITWAGGKNINLFLIADAWSELKGATFFRERTTECYLPERSGLLRANLYNALPRDFVNWGDLRNRISIKII